MIHLLAVMILLFASPAWSQSWPNEPSGTTLLSDHSFSSVTGDGWSTNSGALSIVSDGSAPHSPSSVLQMVFPPGLRGGTSPGAVYFPLGAVYREMWMGFWWKPSSNWEGGAMGGGQKISFFQPTGSWNLVMLLNPDHTISVYFPNDSQVNNCHLSPSWGDCPGTRQLYGGVWNPQVSFGVWHRIETYVKMSSSTTAQNGIIRWWIDGQLAGDFTTVNFPQYPIAQVELDSTWGNVGDTKTTTTQFWFDHVRVTAGGVSSPGTGGGTGGGGTKVDPTIPFAPSNLRVSWLWDALLDALAWIFGPDEASAAVPIDGATVVWDKAVGKRYELRGRHFASTEWATLGTVDAGTGTYRWMLSGLPPGATGDDRYICVEARDVTTPTNPSAWATACNQVDVGQVVIAPPPPPAPVPPPPSPPPAGLSISAATPDQIVITAKAIDCPRILTSTTGSTATTRKRTLTCVR